MDHLDLTVAPGTFHGIVGPNGAGKSTTIGMAVGLVVPDAGDISVLGHDAIRDRAGARAATGRAGELIEVLGITKAAATPLADCSTGNRKKVGLAQALLHAPRLLVLDEPFEAVDPVSAASIRRVLRRFVDGGGTVVLSTHSMLLVEQMCDDVTVIHQGRVVAAGPVTEVAGGLSLEDRFVALVGAETSGDDGLAWLVR